ncbi:hypothetical protein AB0C84_44325 [Actinomadura sp. NPDC048955]|uniref:hypothetical protein n=1 Tax=Actinomadura sp. NPDC048955 TaxID=3158228 RepID=UPI0033E5CD6E
MPGKIHDLTAARIWGILRALYKAGILTLADKAYRGAEASVVITPYQGKNDSPGFELGVCAFAGAAELGVRPVGLLLRLGLGPARRSPARSCRAPNACRRSRAVDLHPVGVGQCAFQDQVRQPVCLGPGQRGLELG